MSSRKRQFSDNFIVEENEKSHNAKKKRCSIKKMQPTITKAKKPKTRLNVTSNLKKPMINNVNEEDFKSLEKNDNAVPSKSTKMKRSKSPVKVKFSLTNVNYNKSTKLKKSSNLETLNNLGRKGCIKSDTPVKNKSAEYNVNKDEPLNKLEKNINSKSPKNKISKSLTPTKKKPVSYNGNKESGPSRELEISNDLVTEKTSKRKKSKSVTPVKKKYELNNVSKNGTTNEFEENGQSKVTRNRNRPVLNKIQSQISNEIDLNNCMKEIDLAKSVRLLLDRYEPPQSPTEFDDNTMMLRSNKPPKIKKKWSDKWSGNKSSTNSMLKLSVEDHSSISKTEVNNCADTIKKPLKIQKPKNSNCKKLKTKMIEKLNINNSVSVNISNTCDVVENLTTNFPVSQNFDAKLIANCSPIVKLSILENDKIMVPTDSNGIEPQSSDCTNLLHFATLPTTFNSLPSTTTSLPSISTSLPSASTSLPSSTNLLYSTCSTLPLTSISLSSTCTTLPSTSTTLPATYAALPSASSTLPSTSTSTTLPSTSTSTTLPSTSTSTTLSTTSTSTTLPPLSSSLSSTSTSLPTIHVALPLASTTLPTTYTALPSTSTMLPSTSTLPTTFTEVSHSVSGNENYLQSHSITFEPMCNSSYLPVPESEISYGISILSEAISRQCHESMNSSTKTMTVEQNKSEIKSSSKETDSTTLQLKVQSSNKSKKNKSKKTIKHFSSIESKSQSSRLEHEISLLSKRSNIPIETLKTKVVEEPLSIFKKKYSSLASPSMVTVSPVIKYSGKLNSENHITECPDIQYKIEPIRESEAYLKTNLIDVMAELSKTMPSWSLSIVPNPPRYVISCMSINKFGVPYISKSIVLDNFFRASVFINQCLKYKYCTRYTTATEIINLIKDLNSL